MHKRNFYNLLFFIISTFILIVACDDTITNNEIDNKYIPLDNVSFQEHILPVFEVKCNSSGCHNDSDRGGYSNLSLTTYSNVIANPLYVLPGEPQNSLLVWSIEGTSSNPMPPVGYPPLTDNQIDAIKVWIDEGCENN